ncbi:hypothetical protein Tco_0083660 [Tanacetum coccineum]
MNIKFRVGLLGLKDFLVPLKLLLLVMISIAVEVQGKYSKRLIRLVQKLRLLVEATAAQEVQGKYTKWLLLLMLKLLLDCKMVVKEIVSRLLEEEEKLEWWFEQDIDKEEERFERDELVVKYERVSGGSGSEELDKMSHHHFIQSSKNYKILSEMLQDFDRMDVEQLFRLVKERYSSSAPEGFDLMLWGDLHTLFEPDEDDEIWKDQHEYNLLSWRLCDFCGIHILLMNNGLAIHMLTEKKYPLSQEMLSKMLSTRLEVDHESSQAFELLRFIRAQVQK